MKLYFEWNSTKAKTNVQKHTVSFEEAATVFGDENSITIDDIYHSLNEKREVTIGKSANSRVLVVVHTNRGKYLRIISARKASKKEKKQYEEQEQK